MTCRDCVRHHDQGLAVRAMRLGLAHYVVNHRRFIRQLADPWCDLAPNFVPNLLRFTVSLDTRDRTRLEFLYCLAYCE